jgi:hypothetical protein
MPGLTPPPVFLSLLRMFRTLILAALLAVAPIAHAQAPLEPKVVRGLALRSLHPYSFGAPLFKMPMGRIQDGPHLTATIERLPAELERFARGGLEAGASADGAAYDWMFAQVYSHVTREILGLMRAGKLKRPDIMKVEIAQFYEVYARNALARLSAEPAWARAARVSRKLARLDVAAGRARHDRMSFAGVVLLYSMYAHITVDLPRVLMMLYHERKPADPAQARKLLAEMQHDFYALTPAFDRSVSAVLSDQWVSWEHADELPPLVRSLVERYGAGTAVRLMRTWAFERFEYNVKKGAHRDALLALPAVFDLTDLRTPDSGLRTALSLLVAP